MEELFPCPFCGGKPVRREFHYGHIPVKYAECEECGMEGPDFDNWEEVFEHWNERV